MNRSAALVRDRSCRENVAALRRTQPVEPLTKRIAPVMLDVPHDLQRVWRHHEIQHRFSGQGRRLAWSRPTAASRQ
jgi:hypothetical protein